MVSEISYAAALSGTSSKAAHKSASPTSSASSPHTVVRSSPSAQSSSSGFSSQTSANSSPTSAGAPPLRATSPFRHPTETGPGTCKAQQIFPRMELLLPGEPVAIDIESKNYQRPGEKTRSRLGWIAVVNTKGEIVLECHVNYPEEKDVKMSVSAAFRGFDVAFNDLRMKNGAVPGMMAEKWIAEIFEGRKVIVHGGSGDRKAFFYVDAFSVAGEVIDTQHIYGQVKLSTLTAREFPGAAAIQINGHTPGEDALAAMNLYLKAHPYDRAAEKSKLEGKGMSAICKPSMDQLRQVQGVRNKHRQAAQQVEYHAKGQGGRNGGGWGGNPRRRMA